MKKTIILLSVTTMLLALILAYAFSASSFKYYRNKEYYTSDNIFLMSQSVNHQFLINYKLDDFEDLDLDSCIKNYEWEHNMQLLLKQGLYVRICNDSVMICTKGFDKNISNKLVNIEGLTLFNYLTGTDIILMVADNVYNVCALKPWEYRWFVNGQYQEDEQTRLTMKKMQLNLHKLQPKMYSRKLLTQVLFHGMKKTGDMFDIKCVCQRQKVDSLIIEQAIEILQDYSYLLNIDEFYLPANLPKIDNASN